MKNLLKQLIQAQSTSQTGELAAANLLQSYFHQHGIEAVVDSWDRQRANIFARLRSTGNKPALLFAGHLDVVGPGRGRWKHPPFAATQTDGKIFGRGAVDMKAGLATVAAAMTQLAQSGTQLQGDILFVATAGEETDSEGAKRFVTQVQDLPTLAGIIIPEPTDFQLITAHRGMLWLRVTTLGKAAHSSTPHLGINAINSMKAVLDKLEHYHPSARPHPQLGGCSVSINTIHAGEALNIIPDHCTIGIDIRTVPGQNYQDIFNEIATMLNELGANNPTFRAKLEILRQVDPLQTDPNHPFVKAFCSATGLKETSSVGFTTDGPYFATLGAPVVIFGPGNPELCHKPDEYIELADLEKAVHLFQRIIHQLLT